MVITSRAKCSNGKPKDWHDKIKMKDVTDGLSNTFLAGEVHIPFGKLATYPEDGALYEGKMLSAFARIGGPGVPLARGIRDQSNGTLAFGSWHPGVCNFVRADGSVQEISSGINTRILGNLCHRRDGG